MKYLLIILVSLLVGCTQISKKCATGSTTKSGLKYELQLCEDKIILRGYITWPYYSKVFELPYKTIIY